MVVAFACVLVATILALEELGLMAGEVLLVVALAWVLVATMLALDDLGLMAGEVLLAPIEIGGFWMVMRR